ARAQRDPQMTLAVAERAAQAEHRPRALARDVARRTIDPEPELVPTDLREVCDDALGLLGLAFARRQLEDVRAEREHALAGQRVFEVPCVACAAPWLRLVPARRLAGGRCRCGAAREQ